MPKVNFQISSVKLNGEMTVFKGSLHYENNLNIISDKIIVLGIRMFHIECDLSKMAEMILTIIIDTIYSN